MGRAQVNANDSAVPRAKPGIDPLEIVELFRALHMADDLESLLVATAEGAARLTRSARATVLLAGEEEGRFVYAASYSVDSGEQLVKGIRLALPIGPYLVPGRQEFVQADGDLRRRLPQEFRSQMDPVEPLLVAPWSRGGKLLGLFLVQCGCSLPADGNKAYWLDDFTEQATITLDRVRVLQGLQRRVKNLAALVALDDALMRGAALAEAVEQVIVCITGLVDAEYAILLLYDPDTNMLVAQNPLVTVTGELIERGCLPVGPLGRGAHVFRTGSPSVVNDSEQDRLALPGTVKLLGLHKTLTVPLETGGQRIGVLSVFNKRRGDFTEEDLESVSLSASHLALLLHSVRLLQGERDTVAALQEKIAVTESEHQRLRQAIGTHAELTSGVLEGGNATAIIMDLGCLLETPVALENHAASLIGCYAPSDGDRIDEGWRRVVENGGTPLAVRENPALQVILGRGPEERHPMRLSPVPSLGFDKPRVIAPVLSGAEVLGWIYVLESNRTLDEVDLMTVELAATLIALVAKLRHPRLGDFVVELVDGVHSADAVLLSKAASQGIDLRLPHTVLVLDVDEAAGSAHGADGENKLAVSRAKLFDAIERVCHRVSKETAVAARNDHIIVFAGSQAMSEAGRRVELNKLVDSFRAEVACCLPQSSFSVGIGGCCYEPAGYSQSYAQARRCLDAIKVSRLSGQTMAFDQLGLYEVLLDGHNRARLLSFVEGALGGLLEYDRQHKGDLAYTLHQFLLHGCHLEETASALCIHLNTLRYRLQRAEQLVGASLHSTEMRLNLQLAFRVLNSTDPSWGRASSRLRPAARDQGRVVAPSQESWAASASTLLGTQEL